MGSDDGSGIMEARLQFVKSHIQPVIEECDKKIQHLEVIIASSNAWKTLLTGHRELFQRWEQIVMTRGVFTSQDMLTETVKIDGDEDDGGDEGGDAGKDDGDERTRRLNRMVSTLNKIRKLLHLTTSTPELTLEHFIGGKEHKVSS